MCFEVLPLNPHGAGDDDEKDEDDDISAMDMDGADMKTSKLFLLANITLHLDVSLSQMLVQYCLNRVRPHADEQNPAELESLNQSLQELLDGIQEDFYAVVDWAYKSDPLRCISMQGVTERYLSGQKADAAGFVRRLLADLQSRISLQFNRVCVQCFYLTFFPRYNYTELLDWLWLWFGPTYNHNYKFFLSQTITCS